MATFPPQSVRSAVLTLMFMAALAIAPLAALAAPFAAYVIDARTGQVLYQTNAETRLHPASLTKMMTLYVTFQAIERGEVPGLIDAISARAKTRGVHIAEFKPDPVEPGPAPFDTYRYSLSVIGHYDDIGSFLSDVAGLRRIIVPLDVAIAAARPEAARALGDTTSAMLEAKLSVKTYVKGGTEGGSSGR